MSNCRSDRRGRLSSTLLLLAFVAAPLFGADRVITTVAGEADGGGVTILRIDGRGVTLGLSAYGLQDTDWLYATAGWTRRISKRDFIDLQADAGRIRQKSGNDPYLIFRAGVLHELKPQRLWAEVETRYIDIAPQHGDLMKGGLRAALTRSATAGVAYYVSISGNLRSHYFGGRLDYTLPKFGLVAGGAVGHAAPVIFGQPGTEGIGRTSITEMFGGIDKPLVNGRLLFVIDVVRSGGVRRVRGLASWTLDR